MFIDGREFEPRIKIPGHEEFSIPLDQSTDVIRNGKPFAAFSMGALRRALHELGHTLSEVPDDTLMFVPTSEPRETLYRTFYSGRLILDTEHKILTICGAEVQVSSMEFSLLELLTSRPGTLWNVDVIMDRVWGEGYRCAGDGSTLRVHIKRLRDKITVNGLSGMHAIQTIRNGGYRFNPDE